MDVASWLRSLGLEQYEATFRDNAIDDSVLPDLTDQDLEKLGILLGHRRKLLRAIANIHATAQTASSAVGATVAVDVSPRDTAERRIDRLIAAGLLFQQGVAPDATYLFKHALVQDAAYGTLLRDPRRALHAVLLQLSKAISLKLQRTSLRFWRVTAPRRT
jgi:SAM domain (Sterile alpha motif)